MNNTQKNERHEIATQPITNHNSATMPPARACTKSMILVASCSKSRSGAFVVAWTHCLVIYFVHSAMAWQAVSIKDLVRTGYLPNNTELCKTFLQESGRESLPWPFTHVVAAVLMDYADTWFP